MKSAQAQFGYNPYSEHPDTGGFFSGIGRAVSSVGRTVVKVANEPGKLAAAAAHAARIPGSKYIAMAVAPQTLATQMGGQVANATLNTIAHPNLKNLAANAQLALKNAGPAGMIASGAIGAMSAGLSGKNLEAIAWAAAEGAAPQGIDTAIKAAEGLRHGKSIITTALTLASQSFAPGTPEAFGFDAAVETLKKSASKVAMGVARNALPSEGARRAFDAAVGVISKSANGAPDLSSLIPRAGSIPNIIVNTARNKITAIPSATQNVLDSIIRNPAMLAGNRAQIANQLRTNAATVNDAMALAHAKGSALLPWRSLQPHVVAWLRRYAPNGPVSALRHPHTNVGGLDSSGTTYIVEKGDGPWAIAQKLSGNGNNWKMLLDYNKDKKPTVDKNVWVGEVLNLPPSWQKPVAVVKAPTAVALPSVPLPTIAPTPNVITAATQAADSIIPAILQAKTILVAWGKTDGVNQSGVSDYGAQAADMSTTMGPRDTLELQSFQSWSNKTTNSGLNVIGNLDAPTLQALQSWATQRATAAVPAATPIVASLPAPTPNPMGGLPDVIRVTPAAASAPVSATPVVASNSTPTKGGSSAPMAIGAVIGGLLFGVPGALIGAAGGAAIS